MNLVKFSSIPDYSSVKRAEGESDENFEARVNTEIATLRGKGGLVIDTSFDNQEELDDTWKTRKIAKITYFKQV